MGTLVLKPTSKTVKAYYEEISNLSQLGLLTEGNLSHAFANLLRACAKQFTWTLAEEYSLKHGKQTIRVDGVLLDAFKLPHGVWEAKDTTDDLEREVKRKFEHGYPRDNILFQAPDRLIIWQNNQKVFDEAIAKPEALVEGLKVFFQYEPPAYEQWEKAAEEFKLRVPELGNGLLKLIEEERHVNPAFVTALEGFSSVCKETINPNLSTQAVEEMLIQHILTERLFRKVFENSDFVDRNVIAREIEKVIQALTSRSFSRHEFLKPLDRFYGAIEATAASLDDFSQKLVFMNTIYEKFFQGFSVKVADTLGIVYTPPPIVLCMVRFIENILQKEFNRTLADENTHLIDPFVGTGSFVVCMMRRLPKSRLPEKYAKEFYCNEVMLLPYYIASMNIEHTYFELTGQYQPFDGISLVDTFELAEPKGPQQELLFTTENTERVNRQKKAPIFVVIGNPPYNAGQVNENDNNKNRKYPVIEKRIAETYAKDSTATLLRKYGDPYVKAIRWASDRIGEEGIVAFITNNSFLTDITFDGMRKNLAEDFDLIYILDLGGNVRKNPKLSGTTHNVFGIQVGVSINIFVRKRDKSTKRSADIFYARLDEFWRKEEKYTFLREHETIESVEWARVEPDVKHNWLTKGMGEQFGSLMPMGTKEAKGSTQDRQTIFRTYSLGVSTNRDAVVYDFDRQTLAARIDAFCDEYNSEVNRYQNKGKPRDIDAFVKYEKVKWSSTLKNHLKAGVLATSDGNKIRWALYRPFTQMFLFYDPVLIDRPGLFRRILPNAMAEAENMVICVPSAGARSKFWCLVTNLIPNLTLTSTDGNQCFPFYISTEDGSNRQENISDWALEQFRSQYKDEKISKWDIFHYVYAILHHPQYREKYAAHLRNELPRIPFSPNFRAFAIAGARLTDLHGRYEDQQEYPLARVENIDLPLDWHVEKMRFSRDKTQLIYNDFLTLGGIPPETFEYRLGNRSGLEWVIDQYQVTANRRSGVVGEPNRGDDPRYIVRLIGKVITVSLETIKVVKRFPALE